MITRELLAKFLDGQCTQSELSVLKEYLTQGDITTLHQILDEDWHQSESGVEAADIENYRERILYRLRSELAGERAGSTDLPRTGRAWPARWKWFAAALVPLFVSVVFWKGRPGSASPDGTGNFDNQVRKAMVVRENNTSQPLTFTLPDGSLVRLDPDSRLSYAHELVTAEGRQVRLEGKAFFDVTKDSLNPFFVRSDAFNVRVLGTSFSVSTYSNKPAEVSVVSGKVAVYVDEQKKSLILEPNERALRLSDHAQLTKLLVEEPVVLDRAPLMGRFDFDETPASAVFAALEKAYDIEIRFDPKSVKDCTLRARLDDQSLFVKLDMICSSLGLAYEVVGTQIRITGDGCYGDSHY